MKRLTYEFVKEQFEKEGWVLRTTEYKNCEQKLDCICSRGHRHSISYHNWKNGWRCPHCSGNVKKDIDFIIADFEKDNYIFLTKEYTNNRQKLDYICPKGHRHSVTWNNWKKGARCPTCANVKRGHSLRLSIGFIRSEFEKENYMLLTKEYKNAKQKLEYICSNGHRYSITWSSWRQGHRCLFCAGLSKPGIEFIRSEFEKDSYILLTKRYKNSRQKLKYICPKGHKYSISWHDWVMGRRCLECYYLSKFGSGNPSWKGGISCEPYCDVWLDKDFKKSIKERDRHRCQNPDCWGKSGVLTIHHIDYNKKNCRPENLITLCNSCNSRANKDREWHKDFYSIIIKKKYNFKEV
jgi:hypothetical protein